MAREIVRTFRPSQPLGSVVQSLLTEAEFQIEYGNNWVLMDGRSVVGSDYQLLDPGNPSRVVVPDARGQFLRGKNNGRTDGNENPDGDLALGIFQDEEVGQHTHDIQNISLLASGASGGGNRYVSGGSLTTDSSTGNETRPKNITVNYFIKINNEAS